MNYDGLFEVAGRYHNVDPQLVKAIFYKESNGNPKAPRGAAGEYGPMQIMPDTAHHLGVGDPEDMASAVMGAAKYLREGLDANNNDPVAAVRYYNGGPGGVNNPKTIGYANDVIRIYPTVSRKQIGQEEKTVDYEKIGGDLLQGKSPNDNADPYTETGAKLLQGNKNDPYTDLGSKLLEKDVGNTSSEETQSTNTGPQPDVAQNFGQGFLHGLSTPGKFIGNKLSEFAQYADEQMPFLKELDQKYGIDPGGNLAASQKIEQDYQSKYGNSLAAKVGDFAGSTTATLPFTGPIGKLGGIATETLADTFASPLAQGLAKAGGNIATGAAQGGVAAGLTGGDVKQGMIAGGALGAAGQGLGAATNALKDSELLHSKIAESVVKGLTSAAGFHFGDFTGFVTAQTIGPIVAEISKKYGPVMAQKAAEALNSGLAASAGGVAGGRYKVPPILRGEPTQPTD